MNSYIKHHEWLIIEEGFHPEYNRASESIFALGNGRMGQRANFEERYTGDSLQGSYVAGIYYPDKTRVGWWKIGYPEYFAKVLNTTNWIGIDVEIDKEPLDLAECEVKDFNRILNMKEGYLERTFVARLNSGKVIRVRAKRFLSIADPEIGAIQYSVVPQNFNGEITFTPYIDADVRNEDANYNEKFWDEVCKETHKGEAYIVTKTKKLDFFICTGMMYAFHKNGEKINITAAIIEKKKYTANKITVPVKKGEDLVINKYAVNVSSTNYEKPQLLKEAKSKLAGAFSKGFETLLKEHADAWSEKWKESDIEILGDIAAQQGIRFNIFQLNQTYTGEDERLNIGPKGFTGEKYGGSTYWDTEAFVLPFYLSTAGPKVAKNLLLYRYRHLNKAIQNAEKLGFSEGAALYPMVTMNGEECHNEWEITFEEIHRNGAIAFAIFNYVRYTGDKKYIVDYGLEVLIGISRFWKQRVNYSQIKQKYVIIGVTGPNEYENNINNNWYTNTISTWTLEYTLECIDYVRTVNIEKINCLIRKLDFDIVEEPKKWKEIINNMYYPVDDETGIFLQQDGYMDKEQQLAEDINPGERPINQNWSWDRILRSCFIKQADVMHGLHLLEEKYDEETIRKNFYFYEPRTVHESSLSACIHSIIAAKLGDIRKAYELYLRTARLDLDDFNNEVAEGLHITSMAGTWLSIVEGFGGMRVRDNKIHFKPQIPEQWKNYSFKVHFRGSLLKVSVSNLEVNVFNLSDQSVALIVFNKEYKLRGNEEIRIIYT